MPIIACGINHKTAAIALREKIFFAPEKIAWYLTDLANNENIREAMVLSTCNRSELYCSADNPEQVLDWFCRQHSLPRESLQSSLYCYLDEEAVQHMMSVACGLDSLVLGEPQILGQMKDAFSESTAAGTVGTLFHRLFQQIFSVAKEVRATTSIGACPVSIVSTAMSLLKQVFQQPWEQAAILLVGAGDTIELMLKYLQNMPSKQVFIVNRDHEKAKKLAGQYQATAASFNELAPLFKQTDIVITATASTVPIINKEMLHDVTHPILMIDLAVPRDVDESVYELPGVKLFTIDDLKAIVQQHVHGREHAADKAKEIIKAKSSQFMADVRSLNKAAATIRAYRKQIEELCDEQLTKSLRQLHQGEDPARVLAAFAYALTNKLLHAPTVQLRQAGFDGRFELLELAQQLFAIPETT